MLEERVQRRLSAILAADVVGYSRLMGEDEAGRVEFVKPGQAPNDEENPKWPTRPMLPSTRWV